MYRFGSIPEIEVTTAPGVMVNPGAYYSMFATVHYTVPDKSILQSYYWGFHDLAPDFPKAHRFSDMWREKIEGTLHFLSFVATPLFANVGRTYQTDLRDVSPELVARANLDPDQKLRLITTGRVVTERKRVILLH